MQTCWRGRRPRTSSTYLKSIRSIRGVLGGFASIKLCVAAEKKSLQFTANRRAVAAAVVLHRRQHLTTLGIPGPIKKAETQREKVKSEQQHIQIWTLVCAVVTSEEERELQSPPEHKEAEQRWLRDRVLDPPRLQEVLLLLIPVEDGEWQHAAGDVLRLLQQLLQLDAGII